MCYIGFIFGGIEGKLVWLCKGFIGLRSVIVWGKFVWFVLKG